MSQQSQFRLPDVGEGLTEAEIVAWRVAVGDSVAMNDIIVEIETAKSIVELPSPLAGTVTELNVAEGETVAVGAPIITIATLEDAAQANPAAIHQPEDNTRMPMLVGYGPNETATARRARRRTAQPAPAHELTTGRSAHETKAATPPQQRLSPRAKPPLRKLAQQLGVDLTSVPATGPDGLITRLDVESFAKSSPQSDSKPLPTRTDSDAEVRIPINGVRKRTAEAMVSSAFTAPHVTEWVSVDISRTMRLIRTLRAMSEYAESRINLLLVITRALLIAVQRNPDINARWDEQTKEIVRFRSVNVGIAAATPRGLIVPNIKSAEHMSLSELSAALDSLIADARSGRTLPTQMANGTITITNIGVFAVDGGTPILNPGEAAILCIGQIRKRPWIHKGRVRPRDVITLSLSFDHRLVDGQLGSRVLADVARILEYPSLGLAWR